MTAFTINDILTRGLEIASNLQCDKVNRENEFVTVVTDVPVGLKPMQDFDFNGTIFTSDKLEVVKEKSGTIKLSDLGDIRVKNLKVCWGTTKVTGDNPSEIFDVHLVIRVLELDDEVMKIIVLRNDYGPALLESYIQQTA